MKVKINFGGLFILADLMEQPSTVLLGLLIESKQKLLSGAKDCPRTYWQVVGSRIFDKIEQNEFERQKRSLTDKHRVRQMIAIGALIITAGLEDEASSVLLGLLTESKERLEANDGETTRTRWHNLGYRILSET